MRQQPGRPLKRERAYEARFIARVARACFGGGGGKGGGSGFDSMLAAALKSSQAAPGHALRPNEPGTPINPPPPGATNASALNGGASAATSAVSGAAAAVTGAASPANGAAGAGQSLGAVGDASNPGVIAPTLSGVLPRPSSGLASNGGAATKTLLG